VLSTRKKEKKMPKKIDIDAIPTDIFKMEVADEVEVSPATRKKAISDFFTDEQIEKMKVNVRKYIEYRKTHPFV